MQPGKGEDNIKLTSHVGCRVHTLSAEYTHTHTPNIQYNEGIATERERDKNREAHMPPRPQFHMVRQRDPGAVMLVVHLHTLAFPAYPHDPHISPFPRDPSSHAQEDVTVLILLSLSFSLFALTDAVAGGGRALAACVTSWMCTRCRNEYVNVVCASTLD